MRVCFAAILLLLSSACATQKMANECPESRAQRCLTKKVCSWDDTQKCNLCFCDEPGDQSPDRDDPNKPRPLPDE